MKNNWASLLSEYIYAKFNLHSFKSGPRPQLVTASCVSISEIQRTQAHCKIELVDARGDRVQGG